MEYLCLMLGAEVFGVFAPNEESSSLLGFFFAGRIIRRIQRRRLTQLKGPASGCHLWVRNSQLYSKPSCWTSPESERMSIIQGDSHFQAPSGKGYTANETSGCFARFEDECGVVKGEGSVGRRERGE